MTRKCRLLLVGAVAVLVVATTANAAVRTHHHCSAATARGKWELVSDGSLVGIGPVAATGIATFDSSGGVSGTQTRSLNGDVADETFTGTYSVNPDCTGTDVVQVFQNGQLTRTTSINVVYGENGREIQGIFTKVELPDGTVVPAVITIRARRLFAKDDN